MEAGGTAEAEDSMAAEAGFMEAEGLAVEAGRMAVECNAAADMGVRTAAGCIAAAGADSADMVERDLVEGHFVAGLALRDGVSLAMRGGFPMRDRL
jgi:hypothetical protein